MINPTQQEVIHNVNRSSARSRSGTTAHPSNDPSAPNTRSTAYATGWSVAHDIAPIPSDSSCAASGGGRSGCPPTHISIADSGDNSPSGQWSQSSVNTAGALVMSYPEPSQEPERRPPVILRVPWWARVLAAVGVAVAAVCLAALVQPVFLVLLIPALLMISERGET